MSSLEKTDVARLAALARIDLNDGELERLAGQLDAIVDAMAVVRDAVSDDIPTTSHPIPMANVHRADQVRPSLGQEASLEGAPDVEGGRFKVPQILGEEA